MSSRSKRTPEEKARREKIRELLQLSNVGSMDDIRAAADGEVMSIAHGPDEERIIRVRHDDGTEALYGNLQHCYVEAGQRVYAGEIIASLIGDQPLAFELRVDGRSVDPRGKMIPFDE